jgi:hypothetical protein
MEMETEAEFEMRWFELGPVNRRAFEKGKRMKALRVILAGAGLGAAVAISACGGGGSTAAVNTSSQSYQMGLATGTNGQAEIAAYGGFDITSHSYQKLSPHDACEGEWNIDNGAAPDLKLSKTDYMAGCLYGIAHNANSTNAPAATVVPPSKKGPNGSTIPNQPGS